MAKFLFTITITLALGFSGSLPPLLAQAGNPASKAAADPAWFLEPVDVPVAFDGISPRSVGFDSTNNQHWVYGGNRLYHTWLAMGTSHTEMPGDKLETGDNACLAFDGDGGLHIAYYDADLQTLEYAYRAGRMAWYRATIGAGLPGPYFAMAVDSDNIAHFAYWNQTRQMLVYEFDSGGGWYSEDVAPLTGAAGRIELALDGQDLPHVAFRIGDRLSYMYRTRNGWEKPAGLNTVYLESDFSMAVSAAGKARLAVDSFDNEWHLGGMGYYVSDGTKWVTEYLDFGEQLHVNCQSMILDAAGRPHLSYYRIGSREIVYARYTGESWDKKVVAKLAVDTLCAGTSLALNAQGYPEVAYYCQTSQGIGELRSAFWHSATAKWIDSLVAKSARGRGVSNSLALNSSGWPLIGYIDQEATNVKLAHRQDGQWSITAQDPGPVTGTGISLALTSQSKVRMTFPGPPGGLQYYFVTGNLFGKQTVDSDPTAGIGSCLALTSDNQPRISYVEVEAEEELRYAYYSLDHWEVLKRFKGSYIGHTSLALDADGHPHICCISGNDVKYTVTSGSRWSTDTLDTNGIAGGMSSIALDNQGHPCIAYTALPGPGKAGNNQIRFAYQENGTWKFETVTGEDEDADMPCLAIPPGKPAVLAYYERNTGSLRYSRRVPIMHTWLTETVDDRGDTGLYPSMKLTPDGDIHISYYSKSARALLYAYFDYPQTGKYNITGLFGVGIEQPERALHLRGANAVFRLDRKDEDAAAFLMVRTDAGGSPLKGFLVGTRAAGINNGSFEFRDQGTSVADGTGQARLTILNDGNVQIPKDVQSSGFYLPSTRRLKDRIRPLDCPAAMFSLLHGVRFCWRENGRADMGFIAEEVAAAVPEAVDAKAAGGSPALDYRKLMPVLLERLKAQQGELAELQRLREAARQLLGRAEATAVNGRPDAGTKTGPAGVNNENQK